MPAVLLVSVLVASSATAIEREGEAEMRRDLQRYGQAVLDVNRDFVDFAATAKGETQFNLFYVAREADIAFLNVYHVRTILDLAMVATSSSDERVIRFVLNRDTNEAIDAIDQVVTSTKKSKSDFLRPDYLKRLDEFLVVLQQLRVTLDRIAQEQ
jgi:hypothetical protein